MRTQTTRFLCKNRLKSSFSVDLKYKKLIKHLEKFDIPIHTQGRIELLEKKLESDMEDIYTLANIYSPLFVQKEANMLVYHHIRLLMNR